MNEIDTQHLRRAIRLAMNGRGAVEPNPMVGCVIVKNERVIGEGYHAHFGGPHAEPAALAACSESPAGATAYVTLEPCCHANKKTPPCAPRLIEAKIARVVVGCLDPDTRVDGKGLAMLRDAGIVVERAPREIESEAKQLIAPYIKRTKYQRPYVTLKWAQSANGQVAGPRGQRVKITNDTSDRLVHQFRSRCDAIAVATNTVLADDPLLTARGDGIVRRERPLLRIVLSNSLKLPLTSKLVASARQQPVIVYCSDSSAKAQPDVVIALQNRGVEVVALPDSDRHFSFTNVLADLYLRCVTHLLVEPGPTLTRYLFARGQADRVWVFRSPKEIADAQGFATSYAPEVNYPAAGEYNLAGDRLSEYLNRASPVFFAAVPSPDFVLTAEANS